MVVFGNSANGLATPSDGPAIHCWNQYRGEIKLEMLALDSLLLENVGGTYAELGWVP